MTGCSTFFTRCFCGGHKETPIYPATIANVTSIVGTPYEAVSDPKSSSFERWGGWLVMLIDTPISIIIDTILLPYDIYTWPQWIEACERHKTNIPEAQRKAAESEAAANMLESKRKYDQTHSTDAVP